MRTDTLSFSTMYSTLGMGNIIPEYLNYKLISIAYGKLYM